VKKNAQIFLVIVGVVILFSSVPSAADHTLFYKKTDNVDAWHWQAWGMAVKTFSDASEHIRFD